MKQKPPADQGIIFSAPMVRALLAGQKTQTRRILKVAVPDPPGVFNLAHEAKHPWPYLDAYCSQPSTQENPRGMGPMWAWWTRDNRPCEQFKVGYIPGQKLWVRETFAHVSNFPPTVRYYATDDVHEARRKRPAIHMPRWASRLTLAITNVRVQRLNEISEADAEAEGVDALSMADIPRQATWNRRHDFANLWDMIHGHGAWAANPYVVAVTFTVAKSNIDHHD